MLGFKPIISIAKYHPAYEISKEKAFQIEALMGFKPMALLKFRL